MKIAKIIVFLTSMILSLGLSDVASGDELFKLKPIEAISALVSPFPNVAISPLNKGQTVPFNGVLLSTQAAQELQAKINLISDQIKTEVDNAIRTTNAQCTYKLNNESIKLQTDNTIAKLQLQEKLKLIDFLEKRLSEAEASRPNTMLWSLLGVGIGSAVTVLLTFAITNVVH